MNTSSPSPYTEPWLRGTHGEVPAAGRAVVHALELALDDATKWTEGLTDVEIHSQPLALTSIAYHLRHIAGSIDRILTYAEEDQLSADQLTELRNEAGSAEQQESREELLLRVELAARKAIERIRVLAQSDLDVPRAVGRKQLPTSLGGAMVHVADHTQRHVGQLVTTAKVLKALRK
jgi:hypothetical protein